MAASVDAAEGVDPFFVDDLLSREEREIRDRVRAFSEGEIVSIMADC